MTVQHEYLADIGRVKVKLPFPKIMTIAAVTAAMVAGLATLPAVSAHASTPGIIAFWRTGPITAVRVPYPCTVNTTYTYGELPVAQITNNCGDRVWLHHYNSDGTIDAYCVNPGNALAYDFAVGYTEIQLTANASQCDAGAKFSVGWYYMHSNIVGTPTDCKMGIPLQAYPYWVYSVSNGSCNFRIWLHTNPDGSGSGLCISPGGYPDDTTGPYPTPVYYQVETTYTQAPCGVNPPF